MIAVQAIRLIVSKPIWHNQQDYKGNRVSSWFKDKQDHEQITIADVLVSGGNDANTFMNDEENLFPCSSVGRAAGC